MGEPEVRLYLTDIEGDVVFYGINTTLSVLLLALIGYNFLLCFFKTPKTKGQEKDFRMFFIAQTLIFCFLATDERFMVHERLGYFLSVNDAFILLGIGILELLLLYYYEQLVWQRSLKNYALVLGGFCFFIMVLIDAFVTENAGLRLAIEDLSKIWAVFFLFIYSFQFYREWEQSLTSQRRKKQEKTRIL